MGAQRVEAAPTVDAIVRASVGGSISAVGEGANAKSGSGADTFYRAGADVVAIRQSDRQLVVKVSASDDVGEAIARLQNALGSARAGTIVKTEELPTADGGTFFIAELNGVVPATDVPALRGAAGVDRVSYAYLNRDSGARLLLGERLIVKLKPGSTPLAIDKLNQLYATRTVGKIFGTLDQFILETQRAEPDAALETANQIADDPDVEWAQPDFWQEYARAFVPNDPLFGQQWHLNNTGQGGGLSDADVDAPLAWDMGLGDPSTVIAIIDDGVELSHPDIAANVATNPFEIPGNGFDDDQNGLVDDVSGWDFVDSDNNPNPSVSGPCENADCHGQSVAGVAAAVGNNGVGVSGACPACRILPVKIFKAGNSATDSVVASAIRYAGEFADVLNNSWGSAPGNRSAPIESAIADVSGGGRGGLGAPVLFSSGNSAAPPYAQFELSGVPPGPVGYAFVYLKDSTFSAGDDAMRIDAVQFPGEATIGFENGSLPPNCASGTTGAPIPWSVVTDASRAYTGQRFVQSGAIGPDGVSILVCNRNSSSGGTLRFQGWISSEPTYDGFEMFVDIGGTLLGPYLAVSGGVPVFIGQVGFPANQPGAWAIGATTNLGDRARYSQFGPQLFLVAPSNGGTLAITTTDRSGTNGYDAGAYTTTFGGTSSAAPLAAGIIGLVLSQQPNIGRAALQQVLQNSADKIGGGSYPGGRNDQLGSGRINAAAAVALVGPTRTPTPRATRTVTTTPTPTLTRTPTPTLTPTPIALPDLAHGKNATKCQRAIVKAGSKLIADRLKIVGGCADGLLQCAQTKAGKSDCPAKATAACHKKIAVLPLLTAKRSGAIVGACAAVAVAELRIPEGLGFEQLAPVCKGLGVDLDSVGGLAGCVLRAQACHADQLLATQFPRASSLIESAGIGSDQLRELTCLSGSAHSDGGAGAIAGAVERCSATIRKASRAFVATELAMLGKCLTWVFACEQAKPGGFAPCVRKVGPKCGRGLTTLSQARRKLADKVQKDCAAVPFEALGAASGMGLDALTADCAARGVTLASMRDYSECLVRHHECQLNEMLHLEVPRADQLLMRVGLLGSFPNVACRADTVDATRTPSATSEPTPTGTTTETPIATPMPSSTETVTPSATSEANTPTPTPVQSATEFETATPTPVPSDSPTPTESPTEIPTLSTTPTELPTPTDVVTETPTVTPPVESSTPTDTPAISPTATPDPTATEEATPPAETPSPIDVPSPEESPTSVVGSAMKNEDALARKIAAAAVLSAAE